MRILIRLAADLCPWVVLALIVILSALYRGFVI